MALFDEIWKKVSEDDGTGTRVIKYGSNEDLVFIYASGFVDSAKYDLKSWLDAFEPSKQEDGTYKVSQAQWAEKEKFYYTGSVRDPFNALLIPEQNFTEAELLDLFNTCIVPSSQATPKTVPNFIRDYKARGLFKNGKIMMDKKLKEELHAFITAFPSPLRVLETNVQKLLRGEKPLAAGGSTKTGYSPGESKVKTTQAQLEAILGGSGRAAPAPKPQEDQMSVKDLQKQIKKRPV